MLLVGALAGCGQTSGPSNGAALKKADEVLADATAAARAAGSVHFVASGRDSDGTASENDLRLSEKGAIGRVSLDGRAVDLLRIGDTAYLKAPRDFYTYESEDPAHDAIAAELFRDRWIVAKNDGMFEYLAVVIPELRTLIDLWLSSGKGRYVNGGEATLVDGRAAVALTDAKTETTLYVSATGEPLPMKLVSANDAVRVTFSDWGEPVELEAPADAIALSGVQATSVERALAEWLPAIG